MLHLTGKLGALAPLRTAAPIRSKPSVSGSRRLIREYRVEASELKVGDVIEHKSTRANPSDWGSQIENLRLTICFRFCLQTSFLK